MAANPKKTVAPPAEPTPLEAAEAEATGTDVAADAPFVVPFRGTNFEVPRDILTDARFRMSLAMMQDHQIVFEALGPNQASLFISLISRGEKMPDVSAEFLEALNKAAGWGNS